MKGYVEKVSGRNITFRVGRMNTSVTLPVKKGFEQVIDYVVERMGKMVDVNVEKGVIVDLKEVMPRR